MQSWRYTYSSLLSRLYLLCSAWLLPRSLSSPLLSSPLLCSAWLLPRTLLPRWRLVVRRRAVRPIPLIDNAAVPHDIVRMWADKVCAAAAVAPTPCSILMSFVDQVLNVLQPSAARSASPLAVLFMQVRRTYLASVLQSYILGWFRRPPLPPTIICHGWRSLTRL